MTKLILLAIAALGPIAVLILWILKRWYTSDYKISKLKGQVDEITHQIVILQARPRSYNNLARLDKLYEERRQLNQNIRRRANVCTKGLFGR